MGGGVFLYVANSLCATSLLPPCSVRAHGAGVSGRSSQGNEVSSRRGLDDNLCRIVPLSPAPFGEASKLGWGNRRKLGLEAGVLEGRLSALRRDGKDGEDEVVPLRLLDLLSLLPLSIGPLMRKRTSPDGLTRARPDLSLTTLQPCVFWLPGPRGLLLVSCFILYTRSVRKVSLNKR